MCSNENTKQLLTCELPLKKVVLVEDQSTQLWQLTMIHGAEIQSSLQTF